MKPKKTAKTTRKQRDPTLGQRVFEAIQTATENGWSVNAIAQATGIPQPSLALWLSGQKETFAVKHLDTLQKHFGIHVGPARKNLSPPKK